MCCDSLSFYNLFWVWEVIFFVLVRKRTEVKCWHSFTRFCLCLNCIQYHIHENLGSDLRRSQLNSRMPPFFGPISPVKFLILGPRLCRRLSTVPRDSTDLGRSRWWRWLRKEENIKGVTHWATGEFDQFLFPVWRTDLQLLLLNRMPT